MRVSLHGGRKGRAKHNDHDFESDHIDSKKSDENRYYFGVEDAENCFDAEVKIFKDLYSETLEQQNEKYRKKGQYGRIRKIEDWIENSRYSCREEILQIGDMKSHASVDDLEDCVLEYCQWKEETFGKNMREVSVSIHVDEATPHAHDRCTWFYHDKNGVVKPGVAKAMEELGLDLPDPTAPVSATNNRMMTYTKMCRDKWQEICISHGFSIEREPDTSRQTGHMGSKQYKAYMRAMEALEAREKAVEEREYTVSLRERAVLEREQAVRKREITADSVDLTTDIMSKDVKESRKDRQLPNLNL